MREIDVFSPQTQDSSIMRIKYSEVIILIGLTVDNVALWPAKMFEWRKVTQDLRKAGSLEMLTITKLIKTKVMRGHRGFLLEVPSHAGMFSPRAANPT